MSLLAARIAVSAWLTLKSIDSGVNRLSASDRFNEFVRPTRSQALRAAPLTPANRVLDG
jgi:hypothetical protein